MMGTKSDMNAQENIALMHFMEKEVLKLAERKNFAGIFTTNTSPLTQVSFYFLYKKNYIHHFQFSHSNSDPAFMVTKPYMIIPSTNTFITTDLVHLLLLQTHNGRSFIGKTFGNNKFYNIF